ncbi:aminotransferase class III-fold pyridoxal phosphate-dependent enzyme, partial [bacterium]|nr:aminotransferase class III-fold pyridoxal phosphate-dependent enzyme [bacterium]
TMGALSLTSKAHFREPFLPLMQGTRFAPYGDVDFLEKMLDTLEFIGELPAAIVYEPIQGEGGVIVPPDDFIPAIRRLCDKYDIMMMADEVISLPAITTRLHPTFFAWANPSPVPWYLFPHAFVPKEHSAACSRIPCFTPPPPAETP